LKQIAGDQLWRHEQLCAAKIDILQQSSPMSVTPGFSQVDVNRIVARSRLNGLDRFDHGTDTDLKARCYWFTVQKKIAAENSAAISQSN